jgi:hypothetical protein
LPQAETLQRLRSLSAEKQAEYAIQLLAHESSVAIISASLEVLEHQTLPANVQSTLLRCYQQLDNHAQKRDIDGRLRAKIISLLGSLAGKDLLEKAIRSFGYSYGHQEVAGGLRAAALVQLDLIDPELTAWYAIQLLCDAQNTSPMSGEPALSAARVLIAQERFEPLYAYLLLDPTPRLVEVISESLRVMSSLRRQLLEPIIERYQHADSGIVAALVDLLLAHAERDQFAPIISALLEEADDALYTFIVTALAACNSSVYHDLLLDLARHALTLSQRDALREAYALRADIDQAFAKALKALE